MNGNRECRTHNITYTQAGVSCFYDSEALNSSFVHPMKFSAKNPRLRKAPKRYLQGFQTKHFIRARKIVIPQIKDFLLGTLPRLFGSFVL